MLFYCVCSMLAGTNGALVSGLMFPSHSMPRLPTQGRKPGRDSAISRLQTQLIRNQSKTCLGLVALNRFTIVFPCVSSILVLFLVLCLGSFWIHFGGSARSPRRRSRSRHRRSRSRSPVAKLKSREVRAPSKTFLGNSLGVFP